MATDGTEAQPIDTAYYDYVKETSDLARNLTERLVFMEESLMASTANGIRAQLTSMTDDMLYSQINAIPTPEFA